MSDLSTADLAGGTTPRDRMTTDTSTSTSARDPMVDTRDPMVDTRDTDLDATDTRSGDSTFESRDFNRDMEARDRSTAGMTTPTPTTTPRTSQLANPAATDGADTDGAASLFPTGEAEQFRSRWVEVQTGFVDEPRSAVEQADDLVAEMMKRLATVFADERARLEEQWSRGDDISTEDLRQALRRYRSFFDRLLSV
jgi:hypothetical protein